MLSDPAVSYPTLMRVLHSAPRNFQTDNLIEQALETLTFMCLFFWCGAEGRNGGFSWYKSMW